MAQVDSKSLEKLIFRLAEPLEVGKVLRQVEIPPDEGDGVLRIILRLDDLDKADTKDLLKFIEAVEDSLIEKDERFPSVRFAEAA